MVPFYFKHTVKNIDSKNEYIKFELIPMSKMFQENVISATSFEIFETEVYLEAIKHYTKWKTKINWDNKSAFIHPIEKIIFPLSISI